MPRCSTGPYHFVEVYSEGSPPDLYELCGHLVFLDNIFLRQRRNNDACTQVTVVALQFGGCCADEAPSQSNSHACRPVVQKHIGKTSCTRPRWDDIQILRCKPLFCSRSRVCSHAKSRNRRMTSGCLFLYCGRSVWVHTLYDTYACKRRHWHSETSLVIFAQPGVSYAVPAFYESSSAGNQEHRDSGAQQGTHRHVVAMLDRIPDCDLETRLYCCICHLLLHR